MFDGFLDPQENWSKLPHQLIEALDTIETVAELKVILYILRHTWGYQDSQKKITLDEFANGRKRKDGSRIDAGTGLSKPSIIDGLKRAEEHGFIEVEEDSTDAARIVKFYSLAMSKDFTPDVKELDIGGKESLHRSEKETPERNIRKVTTPDGVVKPPPLAPDTPASKKAFGYLAEEFAAKGRRAPTKFGTLACKKKFDRAAAILDGELDAALKWAMEQGATSVIGMTNAVHRWAENKQSSGVMRGGA